MPDTHGAVPLGQARPSPAPTAQTKEGAEHVLPPHLAERYLALKELEQSNQQRLQALAAYELGLTQSQAALGRINALVEMLFPDDTEAGQAARLAYEATWQHRLAEMIAEAEEQAGKPVVEQAPGMTPDQLAALGRAYGQFVPGAVRDQAGR